MSKHHRGVLPSDDAEGHTALDDILKPEVGQMSTRSSSVAAAGRARFENNIAAIESTSAASLRIVEGTTPAAPKLAPRAEKVAAVAAAHAAAVDSDSRFPAEAIDAARAERLLGAALPREFGGEGAGISDIVDVCCVLGGACARPR